MRKPALKFLGYLFLIAAFSLCLAMIKTHPMGAQSSFEPSNHPSVRHAVRFGDSAPLRELVKQQLMQPRQALPFRRLPLAYSLEHARRGVGADGALQKMILPGVSIIPGLNLLGIGVGFPNFPGSNLAPDANLAVGATQVAHAAAGAYAVFNKTTGAIEAGPIESNTLWSGLFGSACASNNDGGLVVQYDKMAHRWVLAQNVLSGPPFYTCIAVSQTSDATGSYFEYEYPQPGFPDSPKWGLWPDAYYQSQNNFGNNDGFVGAYPCAYDRSKLLVGDSSALQICFQQSTFDDNLLPADLDSAILPAKGEPEVYLGSIDNGNPNDSNTIYEYLFHVDFANPEDSTFTGTGGAMPITVDSFGLACGGDGNCIPQEGTGILLQSWGATLMYRLAYSNFVSPTPPRTAAEADHQSWVVNHSVTSPGGQVGVRWYEFEAPEGSTALKVNQQSTFAPDSNYRWMGSIAQDKKGDMLLGYSISSSSMFPSINYTGRVPTDPKNTMETEAQMFAGSGAHINQAWGNYTSVALDAQDYCTFWYTNEYQMTTSELWSTRLGSFKFPNCN